jgi:hypothetical protein
MTLAYQNIPINVKSGVMPTEDATPQSVPFWTDSEAIWFDRGRLSSMRGRALATVTGSIAGCNRNLFSYINTAQNFYLIAGDQGLYQYLNNTATNITPVVTSTTAVANSLNTNYATLVSAPLTTVLGSAVVTVNYSATTDAQLANGDSVTISGAATTRGIPNTEINATKTIGNVNTGSKTFTITCTTVATSSGTGGGASVVLATSLIGLTKTSHGISAGKRVKVAAAATSGGVPNTEINAEHVVRVESANKFSFYCTTKATSAVSAAGGAATTYQAQIADGVCDTTSYSGFGAGLLGAGLLGYNQNFATPTYPRIWWMDLFGNYVALTPGQQTGVYIYQNDSLTAPTAISGAPTAVNGLLVDNNQILCWGEDDVGNRLTACDIGDETDWIPAANSEAWTDDIEGADTFISGQKVNGVVLMFTAGTVWRNRYVGKPLIRITERLEAPEGIIAPLARVAINNQCYYMGRNDFYITDGNSVNPASNNTILNHVFQDISTDQEWKSFAWYDPIINSAEFHYPSEGSDEPDSVARYLINDGLWIPDVSDLTAAESPQKITAFPLGVAIADTNTLYRLESGTDDGASAMNSFAETNYFAIGEGDKTFYIHRYYHDAIQTGNMVLTIYTKLRANDTTERTFGPYTLSSTTQVVNLRAHGRFVKLRWEKTATGTSFTLGKPQLGIQEATSR